MNSADTNEVLNFLCVIHNRSLPSYLRYAVPWNAHQNNGKDSLDLIVADHDRTVDRVSEWIIENRGDVSPGEFPMTFTSLHDLSFDYLLDKMIGEQTKMISQIESCVARLMTAPMAKELAEEALGAAIGHLQTLEELAAQSEA